MSITCRTTTRRATAAVVATIVALATVATLTTTAAPAHAEPCVLGSGGPFLDVPEDHPFCKEIRTAQDEGFVTGYPDHSFRPTDVVTRQAAAAILWRVANAGALVVVAPCAVAPFPDVPVDHPFCPEIRDAAAAGVFTGYADGTFRPAQPMSRQAMAMVLARFPDGGGALAACADRPFTDILPGDFLCAAVQYGKDVGLFAGYADGTFRPTAPMTRQAFAAVAVRAWILL